MRLLIGINTEHGLVVSRQTREETAEKAHQLLVDEFDTDFDQMLLVDVSQSTNAPYVYAHFVAGQDYDTE